MNEIPMSSVRNRVDTWMARHNPQLQGESDGKLDTLDKDNRGVSLYEKRIVESFEKEICLIDQEFTEKESELYTAFRSNVTELKTRKEAAEPKKQDDAMSIDPALKVSPFILKVTYAVALSALSMLNFFFLVTSAETAIMKLSIGVVLSAVILATGFFTGNLLYDHYGRRWLLISTSIVFVSILGIFALILLQAGFEWKASVTVLMNMVIFILVLMMTFLSHDIKEVKPKEPEIEKIDYLACEISRIEAERRNNLEYYTKLQAIFVEAAHELVRIYRWSLQKNSPDGHGTGIANDPLPEFKTVELRLRDESGMQ